MALKHASPDCCQDHECDHCPTCAKGRCCRLDNPLHQLPALGAWDGPLFGELGVLAVDATGDSVQCGLCGAWKRKLGLHLWFEHDRTSAEYRALWGLRQSTGLAAPNYKQEVRAANTERLRRVHPRPGYVARLTPEQRSALKKGVGLPLEVLKDPRYKEAMKRVGALNSSRVRLWPCGCGCGGMLPPGNGPHRGQRYIRGHVPPTLADRVGTFLASLAGSADPTRSCPEILATFAGEEESQVRRALVLLVRQGRVVRPARGLYAPAEEALP